jgi:hypothetical protein
MLFLNKGKGTPRANGLENTDEESVFQRIRKWGKSKMICDYINEQIN